MFCFFNSKKITNFNLTLIWSVVISYIVKSIVNIADNLILKSNQLLPWSEFLCTILVAVIICLLANYIYNSRFFKKHIEKFNHKSFNDDIWEDIVDYELGTAFKVFLKDNTIYVGTIIVIEEKGKDSWFALKDYIVIHPDEREYDSENADMPTTVAISFSEVKRIELYYKKNTAIFD